MDPALSASLHEGIKSLYLNNALTDVIIRIDDQTFQCHRLVLSAVSPYFRSMFTCDFKDKDMEEVVLQSVKPEIFQCILQYIYCSEENLINETNVQDVFITASMFLMRHIMDICENFMSEKICADNAISVWMFAKTLPCKSLLQLAKEIILLEFESASLGKEFLELKTNDLIKLISDPSLNVINEDIVCDAVLRWMSADEEARKNNLYEVLQHVRLPFTSPDYIFSLGSKYPFLYENLKLVQLLDEAKYFHCQKRSPNNSSSKRFIHRNSSEMVNGMICVMGEFVQLYSFQDQKWTEASSLPCDPGTFFASCVHGNNFYISGGGKNQLGKMFKFKANQNRWISLTPLGKLRSRHALVAGSKMIYLIGGSFGKDEFLSDVTEYNKNQNAYMHIGDLETPVRSMDAVLMEQKIYVFGGKIYEGMDGSRIVQYFDLSTKQGTKITSELPKNVIHTGALFANGVVFLVGGDGHLVEWRDGALQQSQASHVVRSDDVLFKVSMCYFDGHVYICTGTKQEIDVFDEETCKQRMLNCHPRLTSSKNLCAIGSISLPKKYFK